MHPISRELSSSINTLNSLLHNQNHNPIINNSIHSQMHFDHNNEFLEQILSSSGNQLEDQSKLSQHQISNDYAALMQYQQSLLSRGFADGLLPDHHNDVYSFVTACKQAIDAPVKALFDGSMGNTSNQPHHFNNPKGGAMNKPAASGGGTGAQPRQRVRARRGQATDPHSIAERLRRERIAERMKGLQEIVPNANKTDKASMMDEIIDYVKFLQLQVKVLSMSRLGGAAAIAPLVADISSEGKSTNNATETPSSPNNNEGVTVTEQHVVKLMEEDMGSAMQYLQGKGLCLMPISLANTISTSTSMCQTTRNPLNANGTTNNKPLLNGELGVSTSPSLSSLPVQSAAYSGMTVENTVPSKT